ncbi:MAG: tetratricopeptide repeat protein [Planctomycetaceae bacterium]|nr:tetratricopeptide repeat protein [Planctomycetaceae bacterium]
MLRSHSSPTLHAFLLTACVAAAVANAAEPQSGPRTLMRLPGWVDSATESAPQMDTPAGRRAAPAPLVDTASAPVTNAVGPSGGTAWNELVPVAAADGPPGTRQAAPAAPKPPLVPETNGLKRWINNRVAQLPKPTGLIAKPVDPPAPAEKAEPTATPAAAKAAAPVNAPVAATPDEMPTLSIDPASFRGVNPGKTTRAELLASWGAGEALGGGDGTTGFAWKIEPFDRVEVALDGDTVATILVKLAEPVPVTELARQLEIADIRTVTIFDDQGVSIGEVYPERGVILSVKPGTQSATAIMIEPLDPESFVLRAESEIESCSAYAVADLQYAIQIDPQHVRAHRLLLGMTTEQGKWTQAITLAETATRLDPADAWTQLKYASALLALDRPAEARAVLMAVKARENPSPLVVAQAERLLGRVALAGATPDHQAAVQHFAEAIRRASPLLVKRAPAVQTAAREVLLDAHLGTALAIARGTWQQKGRVIPKWISRSETIVTEFQGRQIDWETGQGLADALAAAQKRGDAADLLDNATLTAAYLERGAEQRELTAAERKKMGELMFRIGIMYSLQRGDHATAVTWFDRTVPLWEGNDNFDRDGDLGRLGESYVSMAISYWQVDRRADALALSRHGVDLMVAAVDKSQLEERSLAVAYGNLSTMYAEEGDDKQSQTYAEMASRAEASGSTLR